MSELQDFVARYWAREFAKMIVQSMRHLLEREIPVKLGVSWRFKRCR